MNIVYCRLIIVLAYIGYSLPFGDGSIKLYAHVLHDVSITVVKKLKFYRSFHQLFDAWRDRVLEILTENKMHKK